MNKKASEALLTAAMVKDPEERKHALDLWAKRWCVLAEIGVRIEPNTSMAILGATLAQATKQMVETMALTGAQEKILAVNPSQYDPKVSEYSIEMTCLRYEAPPVLAAVPPLPRRGKKK